MAMSSHPPSTAYSASAGEVPAQSDGSRSPLSNPSPETLLTACPGRLSAKERQRSLGVRGATVLIMGLSSAGKSTVGAATEARLVRRGRIACLIDGDDVRLTLCSDLGFARQDRGENARRCGKAARLFAEAGVVCLLAIVAPYAADRKRMREDYERAGIPYFEVYVNTPLSECERRDPKGLYARARAGVLTGFTGVDDPFEPPPDPELELTPDLGPPSILSGEILELLGDIGEERR
jgi:adenylyl-sulfate kinase